MSTIKLPVLASIAATVTGLVLAAALSPDQSPILPIELCVVLCGIAAWVAWRPRRPALATAAVFAALLAALSVHILVGDLDAGTGARELVPDVLVLGSAVTVVVTAGRRVLRGRPSTA